MSEHVLSPQDVAKITASSDAISHDDYVVVDYAIGREPGRPVNEVAALMAINTSIGPIERLPFEVEASRTLACARVVRATEDGHVSIAFPVAICGLREGIAQLLQVMLYTLEYDFAPSYRIEDVRIPRRLAARLQGPRFGAAGIRQEVFSMLQRPPVGVIWKPRSGAPMSTVADLCKAALVGGADYIADDELIVDPEDDRCFRERVEMMVRVTREAEAETGEAKAYFANICASPSRMMRYAKQAKALGVNGVLVNAFAVGLPVLEDFARARGLGLPVIATNMGASILTRPNQPSGFSEGVVSKLSRLAGADAVYSGISNANWYTRSVPRSSISELSQSLHGFPSSFRVVAGGLNVSNLWLNMAEQGPDVMVQAGAAILGYGPGPDQAASEFRAIVDAVPYDLDMREARERIARLADRDRHLKNHLRNLGFEE